jgi:hypothetical protein
MDEYTPVIQSPANIIERQLALSLPNALERAIHTLEFFVNSGSPEQRLNAAKALVQAAVALAKIKP